MIDNKSNKTSFRYDINALRAIAVLGVVFFHFKVPYFSGGFSGVDIFFVISGYLMTRIIINGINRDNFSFADFYGKRVRRIIPALLCAIGVVTVICFFLYFPIDYKGNEKNAASSLLFLSNIFYWQNSSYFDPASDTNLFLHTWSLSVEWQFYMLYPVVLVIFNRLVKNRSIYLILFITGTLILFGISVFATSHNPTASFYLLPTRAWEMLLGGVAFLTEDYFKGIKYKKLIILISYLTLILGIVLLNEEMAWPGTFTLIPTIATFLIIVCNASTPLINNALIQYIGKVSYSIYLWHWPIFVISQYMGVPLSAINIILMTMLSIGLADLSFRYIESRSYAFNKPILLTATLLLALTTAFSIFAVNRFIFQEKALQLSEYKTSHNENRKEQFSDGTCFMNLAGKKNNAYSFNTLDCISIDTSLKNFLLIGDSHAAQFSRSFKLQLQANNIKILQATASGCLPLIKDNGDPKAYKLINDTYRSFLVKNSKKINGVIISGNWIRLQDDKDKLLSELNQTIDYIEDLGIKVIILGQNEVYSIPFPTIVAKESQFNTKLSDSFLSNKAIQLNAFLKKNLPKHYIDIYNLNPSEHLSPQNVPYMFDENHFTQYGADLTVKKIIAVPQFVKFSQ